MKTGAILILVSAAVAAVTLANPAADADARGAWFA